MHSCSPQDSLQVITLALILSVMLSGHGTVSFPEAFWVDSICYPAA